MPSRSRLVADVRGSGPAVVLLHGQPGLASHWSRVRALLEDRYLVVAPDRLGYGRTGGGAGDFDANAHATLDLLDRLGISAAIVVAHSWAGGVAIRLAAESPARVAGLVLVSSVAPGVPVGRTDRILALWPVGDVAALGTLGISGRLLSVPAVRRTVESVLPASTAEIVVPGRGLWRAFATEQRAYVAQVDDLAGDLGRIEAPTRVLIGASDRVVGPRAAPILAAGIRGASLVTVAGAGHLLPWDHPEVVAGGVDAVAAPPAPPS